MKIEETVFKKYKPNFKALIPFGFIKKGDKYFFEKEFFDGQFKSKIEVDKNGFVRGKVYDTENNDEYLPLRIETSQGAFVNEVRTSYRQFLENIREKCFLKEFFIYPQSNRIANLIVNKYGDPPEFLWEKFQGSGVFRNIESNKWYCAILDVDRGKLQKGKSGIVEVIDLKLSPENVQKIIKKPHFYKGWHMNKKYWISVILDETVPDETIMELIEESHSFTVKKKKYVAIH